MPMSFDDLPSEKELKKLCELSAKMCKWLYDEFVKQGFTHLEAIQLVASSGHVVSMKKEA